MIQRTSTHRAHGLIRLTSVIVATSLISLAWAALAPAAYADADGRGQGSCANGTVDVSTSAQLTQAAAGPCNTIRVRGHIAGAATTRLTAGKRLVGGTADACITFLPLNDGIELTSDNSVSGLRLETTRTQRAIFNDTLSPGLGTVRIASITTVGQVQLLAEGNVSSGDVHVNGLDIVDADTSLRNGPRSVFYGTTLEAMQGAFMLWNEQSSASSVITADLHGISVGRPGAPVTGSGVAVFGAMSVTAPTADGMPVGHLLHQVSLNPTSGSVQVDHLETGSLYTDGGLVPARAGAVLGSAAVFVGAQAPVQELHVAGSMTTTGLNAGGTDIFSDINTMTYDGPITTYGFTGIGIVTWPYIGTLTAKAPITTYGAGARGFNAYSGHVGSATFDKITTSGPGSPAVDIFATIDFLHTTRSVETSGPIGPSLVLGQFVALPSNALRVAEGGNVDAVQADGVLKSTAPLVDAVVIGTGSRIGTLCAAGGIQATGLGSKPIDNQGSLTLTCS